MTAETVYAVIDLETTGTAYKNGDRIIQFGCALMKKGKIIQTVSQLVNPDGPIPEAVQRLTGISAETVVTAPDFQTVAPMISQLLAGTVIVAHNVNFDYPFLSAALVAAGQPALTNDGIDTVQLAQILMPEAASFRLGDLTAQLNIKHDNPHHADSDAVGTAKLLWQLRKRFLALPSHTQRQLVALGEPLLRETGRVFERWLQPEKPLPETLMHVGQFVIQRPLPTPSSAAISYPDTEAAKRKLLRPRFRFRKQQANMMDTIYQNANGDQPIMVEAGTGLGKTMGYLMPLVSLADATNKLCVAVPTVVLQEQVANVQVPLVGELVGEEVATVVDKSAKHYLDLNRLANSLSATELSSHTLLLQLKLLVWLTQTTTGDLDELRLTSYQAPLFRQVRHTGHVTPATHNPYHQVDFYLRHQQQLKKAVVVVSNHAYFARHGAPSKTAYLVVDEAQHFAKTVAEANARRFDLATLRQLLLHIGTLIGQAEAPSLASIFAADPLKSYQLTSAMQQGNQLAEQIGRLQKQLQARFIGQLHSSGYHKEPVSPAMQRRLFSEFGPELTGIGKRTIQLTQTLLQLSQDDSALLTSDQAVVGKLTSMVLRLAQATKDGQRLLTQLATEQPGVVTLAMANAADATTTIIEWQLFDATEAVERLLEPFKAPIFVGATLTVHHQFDFLARQLGVDLANCVSVRLKSPFRYRKQALMLSDENAPTATSIDQDAYADYLAEAIFTLSDHQHQTLVLFTSLTMIHLVYTRLMAKTWQTDKEVLAQGVTGSADKIAKRFALTENGLLLGAASFFEGIDYPDKQLECVIVTRLPFDAPNDPVIHARYRAIEANGGSAFKQDALPTATLRLRQIFGRLIRSESDRGVFVVLDPRLRTTQFGRRMQKSLPPIDNLTLPLAQIPEKLEQWLNPTEKEA